MTTFKRRVNFYDSDEGKTTRATLIEMSKDLSFNTADSYSANIVLNPDHSISFVDKHMKYLNEHQSVNLDQYLANLRLMTRIRR